MKKIGYSLMALSVLAFNVWAFGEISFDSNLSIQKENSKNLFIDVGAGNLNVKGANVDEITVDAKIYSEEYSDLDDLRDAFESKMEFSLNRNNSVIVLKAMNKSSWFGSNNSGIAIDLEVTVPRNMDVEIDDGSGSMRITDIDGNLEIDDGSGSSFIQNIGGSLTVDDGSGNLEISFIEGDVKIDDGSGSTIISNVNGSVFIDDGSGEVKINTVSGNVTVDDGSGSIKVIDMAGVFKLINGGSGSVYVNGKKWIDD